MAGVDVSCPIPVVSVIYGCMTNPDSKCREGHKVPRNKSRNVVCPASTNIEGPGVVVGVMAIVCLEVECRTSMWSLGMSVEAEVGSVVHCPDSAV